MGGASYLLLVAVLVRVLLLWQGSQDWLGKRIEISTPINQWMRSMNKPMNKLKCLAQMLGIFLCVCSKRRYFISG